MRILLLQARKADDPCLSEEVASFARAAGVPVEAITAHDLLQGPPDLETIRAHDALMVGGSGEFYVTQGDLPHQADTLERLRQVAEAGHPTFASCFGFQLMVEALGGELVHDPERMEVGTYEVTLTDDGARDDLFGALPRSFQAQLGRKDRAERLPPGAVSLAGSERAPIQALRIPGKRVWASQFHPELDAATNKGRFLRYLEGYGAHMTPEELDEALDRYRESPEASGLLRRFLALL
jgi:GMP synthase (glutamine-hydrolysing)